MEILIGLLVVGAVLGVAYVVFKEKKAETPDIRDTPFAPLIRNQTAVIEEEFQFTSWGNFSRIGLGVALFFETFALLGSQNVLTQIQAGVMFIGSSIVFGIGIALGRKRTLRVYKKAPPPFDEKERTQ